MRRIIILILTALVALIVAPPAQAAPTEARQIERAHKRTCPTVVEYAQCSALQVTIANYGPTGWTATAGPAAGTVRYNTYYNQTYERWQMTVAHEVGGHHDAWAELVARVGVSQAWVDYYQIDTLAQTWLAGKGWALTATIAKEVWLDCEGPVAHGYGRGAYMINRGMPLETCTGWRTVMEGAVRG